VDKSRRAAAKQRRKKSEKSLKLKILNVENDGEVLECLLESGKQALMFKFSPDIDKTDDIADSLVRLHSCFMFSK